jgi:hypothetical protein
MFSDVFSLVRLSNRLEAYWSWDFEHGVAHLAHSNCNWRKPKLATAEITVILGIRPGILAQTATACTPALTLTLSLKILALNTH